MATYETDSMIILILQVRKEGIEKLNVFSKIIQLVCGKTGTSNLVLCNSVAFGIALQPGFLTSGLMLTLPKPLIFVLLGVFFPWQEHGYPGNPLARMAVQL